MYHHSFLIEFLKAQSIPSREATYRPAIVGPSESSSKALVADSALRQIDLPNYKELFSVSSDRATNKRKYEEMMMIIWIMKFVDSRFVYSLGFGKVVYLFVPTGTVKWTPYDEENDEKNQKRPREVSQA